MVSPLIGIMWRKLPSIQRDQIVTHSRHVLSIAVTFSKNYAGPWRKLLIKNESYIKRGFRNALAMKRLRVTKARYSLTPSLAFFEVVQGRATLPLPLRPDQLGE